jgi:hypothetical protein
MPGQINALREPLLTLLMRVEIRLDGRNQVELSPSLDVCLWETSHFFKFLGRPKGGPHRRFRLRRWVHALKAARIGRP